MSPIEGINIRGAAASCAPSAGSSCRQAWDASWQLREVAEAQVAMADDAKNNGEREFWSLALAFWLV